MAIFWGIGTCVFAYLAWMERRGRRSLVVLGLVLSLGFAALVTLAVLDSSRSRVYDCRHLSGDEEGTLTCRTDHWLPRSLWRWINP